MTNTLLYASSIYAPPPIGVPPPVRIEVYFDPEDVDRRHSIPVWLYRVEITLADFRGIARAGGGTVVAINEADARLRIYENVIEILGELLAERVSPVR